MATIEIDARGPRFSALLTTVVLAIALVTGSVWVAAFQAVVFAIGATKGPQFTPYAFVYRSLIKPRLKMCDHLSLRNRLALPLRLLQ
jgi:hypothetical protein